MHVLGIDVALLNTGVAEIRDGRCTWRSTIKVEGEGTGPRFSVLRRGFERLATRVLKNDPPSIVAVEEPELGIRKGHTAEAILKLYGAFAVIYAECCRLWPKAQVMGMKPDSLQKSTRAGIMRAIYKIECRDSHQADALMLAHFAWEIAVAQRRAAERGKA